MFPAVYTASLMAGERSGNLDAVIRRYVAYEKIIGAVKRRTISALIYPAILVTMMIGPDRHHRAEGGAGVRRVLLELRHASCRCRRGSSSRSRRFVVNNVWLIVFGAIAAAIAVLGWLQAAGAAAHGSIG